MSTCPRCQSYIEVTDIVCPHCRLELKAHGHPGIELHRAAGEAILCTSCAYQEDDSCTLPQRPHAKTCTLYQSINATDEVIDYKPQSSSLRLIWQRHRTLIIVLAIFGVSILIAVS
ncbi:MAG: zinc ribbon domain-containing protein [Leptolyngbyaceae cyanobacterium]